MKSAVIYARVSTEGQDIENSISAQIKICKEYADKNNFSITEIFTDEAQSGTSDKRPEFQRMIHLAKQKQFEIVLVHTTDRFARNSVDSDLYKRLLKNIR